MVMPLMLTEDILMCYPKEGNGLHELSMSSKEECYDTPVLSHLLGLCLSGQMMSSRRG